MTWFLGSVECRARCVCESFISVCLHVRRFSQ